MVADKNNAIIKNNDNLPCFCCRVQCKCDFVSKNSGRCCERQAHTFHRALVSGT